MNIFHYITGKTMFKFIVCIIMLNGVLSIYHRLGSFTVSDADAKLAAAEQQYAEAMKGHCSVIGKRVYECYEGNAEQCAKLTDSIKWFVTKYNEAPELACPHGTPRFLVEDEA